MNDGIEKVTVLAERRKLMADRRYEEAEKVRRRFLELVKTGLDVRQALDHPDIGRSYSAYKKWRERDLRFAAEVDVAVVTQRHEQRAREDSDGRPTWEGSDADFFEEYFGMRPAWHQQRFITEFEEMALGDILLSLWPPEHGKTTTFENVTTKKFGFVDNWRVTVASENIQIAKKILGRIKNRLEPDGPFKRFVQHFGPFRPQNVQDGAKVRSTQPWGAGVFNIFRKAEHDERDFSMQALGYGSSIVSTRCDHLHIDDLQSVKTFTPQTTNRMEAWFRQDAITRPGEYGKTTICGTRVGEDDVYERILADDSLEDILHVLRFPAVRTDQLTGEQVPLWPTKYTLYQLERMAKKAGPEAWDRNYMQNPGASDTNRTFSAEMLDGCKDPTLSLHHPLARSAVLYLTLDPALGGRNCVMALEVTPGRKLVVRFVKEATNLKSNRQIAEEVNIVASRVSVDGAQISDLIVETMNFQRALMHDQDFERMRNHYAFAMRGHYTGSNKYDEGLGIPSMVSSFIRKEIVLPWADDPLTREQIGELIRQFRMWKPGVRGKNVRMDMLMALWFGWLVWRERHQQVPTGRDTSGWRVGGVPSVLGQTRSGLVVPVGALR